MGAMVVVLVVLVVLAVCLGAAWLIRRRGGDAVHSVEGYQHTLTTLQGIRSRSPEGTVRVLGGSPARPPDGPSASEGFAEDGVPRADDAALAERPGPKVPDQPIGVATPTPAVPPGGLVFEDASLGPPTGSAPTSQRSQNRAMTAMNHRPRHLGVPIVAAALVVVVAVVLFVVGSTSRHHKPGHTAGATTTSAPHHAVGGATTSTTSTTTTTTAPASQFLPSALEPSAAAPSEASYRAPATYSVTVAATSGESWVQVTSGGATLFAQTLQAGQQQTFPVTGAATVLLGAPVDTRTTINQLPVVYPAYYQTPLTLTLVASATPEPTTTQAPTTTTTTTAP